MFRPLFALSRSPSDYASSVVGESEGLVSAVVRPSRMATPSSFGDSSCLLNVTCLGETWRDPVALRIRVGNKPSPANPLPTFSEVTFLIFVSAWVEYSLCFALPPIVGYPCLLLPEIATLACTS